MRQQGSIFASAMAANHTSCQADIARTILTNLPLIICIDSVSISFKEDMLTFYYSQE